MEIRDFWDDLKSIFGGQSEQINEIDLMNLKAGSMAQCLDYIFKNCKDCSCQFTIPGSDTQVVLPSPHAVVNYVLQEQVSVVMWLTFPAIPMLSLYIDFSHTISFGFVRGTWNAIAVLAFFDLMYELKHMSPDSILNPVEYTFTVDEREKLLTFWQDYDHAAS